MHYTYYLFDLDGTLVNTTEGVINCITYALDHFGIRIEDTVPVGWYMGPPLIDSFRRFAKLPEEDAQKAVALYRERYNRIGKRECFVPEGIESILKGLKAHEKVLAVATSKLESSAIEVLDSFHLTGYFSTVSGADPEEKNSSKEAVIRQTFQRLQITDGKRVLMIGDRKYDILGANKFGIDSLGIYAGTADKGELEEAGATYVAHSVEEMKNLLL